MRAGSPVVTVIAMRVVVKHPGEAPMVEDISAIEDVLGDGYHVAWADDRVTVYAMNGATDYNLLAPVEYRAPVCGPIVAVAGDVEFTRSQLALYCEACARIEFAMS